MRRRYVLAARASEAIEAVWRRPMPDALADSATHVHGTCPLWPADGGDGAFYELHDEVIAEARD